MKRGSGVLCHITSLPSGYGIGDLGPTAREFADLLAEAGQTYWQILPLTPTMAFTANSPYSSYSTFAGNYLLISPEQLVEDGWCESELINRHYTPPTAHVDFEPLYAARAAMLRELFDLNQDQLPSHEPFQRFCEDNADWLESFALYVALKEQLGDQPWNLWPASYRDREPSALAQARERLAYRIQMEQFAQYLFFSQWQSLKAYCNERGIAIIGDLPIYVSLDSSDVWQSPDLFKLDEHKRPIFVAGVPPDYFSKTGQRWGNPVYDWERMQATKYAWWLKRIAHQLKLYDHFRLDHFRGLVAYWEILATEKSAVNGQWVKVPHESFFKAVYDRFPGLPMIAEDLGTITDDVLEVMQTLKLPGMRVFQFGFSGDIDTHPYLPHNYVANCVAYTGTHDNNTTLGWFNDDLDDALRELVKQYLQTEAEDERMLWALFERMLESKANVVIFPVQDIVGLESHSRMNQPSTVESNWRWRLLPAQIRPDQIEMLTRLTAKSNRS